MNDDKEGVMLRLLFGVLLISIFTSQSFSQAVSSLLSADQSERRFYDVADLAGPVKSVAMERAQFSPKRNEAGQYVEEKREYIKTFFFDKEGKVTGTMPFERGLQCGNRDYEEVKCTELRDARGGKTGVIEEGFDREGKLRSKAVYEYDSKGLTRAISWTIYDDLGAIIT